MILFATEDESETPLHPPRPTNAVWRVWLRPAFLQPEVMEDGVPDALHDIAVAERRARIGSKHERALAGDLTLGPQGLVDRAGHLDIDSRTVSLRVFTPYPGPEIREG